jgi:hypothetical protein
MNAPDKIYVSRNFSEDNSPHGLWYLNKSEHDINVEYIRKDALLEWAKGQKAWLKQGYKKDWKNDDTLNGGRLMLDKLINKIESL